MPRKPVKKKTRKSAKRPAAKKLPAVNWSAQGTPQQRTSMWLGEDLLLASDHAAARLGVSRTKWVQMTLRAALGLPAIPVKSAAPPMPPAPTPELSVFG